jgi:hypothetical protein
VRPADAARRGDGSADLIRSPAPILSPAVFARMLRLDARRPASWLAAAGAVVCGVGCATGDRGLPAVVAAGGLVAVAAIGHVPAASRTVRGPQGGSPEAFVPGWRVLWPMVGFLLAAVGMAARGSSVAAPLGGALSAGGAAGLFALLLRARCTETVAASGALVGAAAAASAALAAHVAGSGPLGQGFAAVAAGSLVTAGSVIGLPAAAMADLGSASDIGRHRRPEAGASGAMAAALVAMVGCYFLAPQFAWAYAAVAAGWFVGIAVPPATAAPGSAAAVRLARSAAGHPALPGSLRRAARATATMAGLLAWPAIVALVLPAVEGDRVGGPLVALAWLVGMTVLVMLAVSIAVPVGRAEDARAVVLSLVAIAAVGAAQGVARLPVFSGFSSSEARQPARSGVEPLGASCKTSQSPQSAWLPSWRAAFVESAALRARYKCIQVVPVVTISPVL